MSGQTPSVLVIDDEEMIRESLQVFLEADGWAVAAAASAEEALEMLAAGTFDVAIVDIRLPGISGRDFVLRAHAERPELRFLIFTGSTAFRLDAELAQAGMSAGDIFAKPLDDLRVLAEAARRVVA